MNEVAHNQHPLYSKFYIEDMFKSFLPILGLCALTLSAQQVTDLGQVSLSRWGIGSAQYSGIAPMGNDMYAVVSDKEPTDGFFVFRISQNGTTGKVMNVYLDGFYGNPRPQTDRNGISTRDCEGIAYHPSTRTVFISGEGDQEILEYSLEGKPTGRQFNIPAIFKKDNIVGNYGFEALSYSPETQTFWTTTESMLPGDGEAAGPQYPGVQNLLRLQSFGEDLQPKAQYAYRMDRGRKDDFGMVYAYGVPSVLALPNGRLLVLEREANVSKGYFSSEVICKIFEVNPAEGWQIDSSVKLATLDSNRFLTKKLIATFTTRLTPFNYSFANYEGMCLGAKLKDGRQTLLLISDSQGGFGKGPVHLKDYLRVLVLE